MKRIVLIIVTMLVLASCSVTRQRQTFVSFLDYRPYTSADFFLSPDPCVKDFDSIGQLYIDVIPGTATPTTSTAKNFNDNIYSKGGMMATTYEVISSEELLEIGRLALRIISLSFVMAAVGIVCSATFQALGKSTLSLITSVLRQLVVILPAAYVLAMIFELKGVWWAFPAAEVVALTVCLIFLRKLFVKVIKPLYN